MPTTSTEIAMLGIRRRDFAGQTDKYLSPRKPAVPVIEQVRKELGFLDGIADASIYNELYRETARERMAKYKQAVDYYHGRQYTVPFEDGEKKPVFNFCDMVVNKSVDFFVAKGFELRSVEGNESVAEAMELVWRANDKAALFRKIALTTSICGDAFVYVTIDDKGKDGKPLEKKDWRIVLNVIDPFFVFPAFDEADHTLMTACLIQFPVSKNDRGDVVYKTYYFTKEKYSVYQDGAEIDSKPNPFGMVPVAHFVNYIDPLKVWGNSDLESITELNDEYNTCANSIRKIIKYHAEPTTIIFGARASKLEKGAKKVWSGLPVDARVENLAYSADLKATYDYLNLIENKILKLGNIPTVAFQTDVSTSHTSGLSIRMAYQPLFDKSERKRIAFTTGFKRTTAIMAKAFELIGIDLAELADNPAELLNVTPEFSDPLPFDEVAQLDADIKKLSLKVTSSAALLRKYNPGEDISRLTTEIIADQIADWLREREQQIALQGGMPNPNAAMVSSIALGADLGEFSSKLSELKLPPVEPSGPPGKVTPPVKPDTAKTLRSDSLQ